MYIQTDIAENIGKHLVIHNPLSETFKISNKHIPTVYVKSISLPLSDFFLYLYINM